MSESTIFRVHQLINPTGAEIDEAVKVLVNAFENDVFSAIVTGWNPKDLPIPFAQLKPFIKAQVIATSLAGEIHVAENTENVVVGVALWFEPGRQMFESEAEKKEGLLPLLATFTPELQAWWATEFLPQYDAFTTSALGPEVKNLSWQLQGLGVLPAFMRKGVARSLIEAKIDSVKKSVFLEAEREINLIIYKKLGFEAKGETYFKSGENGFPMWSLIRTAVSLDN